MTEHDDEWYRKYLEAGAAFGQAGRARAEALVRDLMGDREPADAKRKVEDLVDRSKKVAEDLVAVVRTEVATQLTALGVDAEHLGNQLADMLRRTATGQRGAKDADAEATGAADTGHTADVIPLGNGTWTAGGSGPAKKKATPRKAPAKKAAPATSSSATTAAKAPAKKAPAKKATSSTAPAKKAAPATKKAAPAKKAASTTAAKKTAAKTAAPAKKAAPKNPIA